MPLSLSFFAGNTVTVAREMLGKKLVRQLNGATLSGTVVETEAYLGQSDSASHAFKGHTPRTATLFGPPGLAYVYFIYGMHYMLNAVTENESVGAAVLIRAIDPVDGLEQMKRLRGKGSNNLCNGPARLCQAFGIDKSFNQWDLTAGDRLWFEDYTPVAEEKIATGPRVRINYATPEDRDAPLRFWLKGNRHVSKP